MGGIQVPQAVGAESHGRLGMSAIMHGMDPAIDWVAKVGLCLAIVTLVIVLVDLVMRGRMRRTSFAFTYLLICLPLVGAVYATAQSTVNYWLILPTDDHPLGNFAVIQVAVAFQKGSFLSGLGMVLAFVLRLDDAWRGRKVDQPRATNP